MVLVSSLRFSAGHHRFVLGDKCQSAHVAKASIAVVD